MTANIDKNNQGKLQLTALEALGAASNLPAPGAPVRLSFDGAGNVDYQEFNAVTNTWSTVSTQPFTSGLPITVGDWSITLTGTVQAGDVVTVGNALDLGEGFKLNAGNAGGFMELRDKTLFDEGTSLADGFSAAMASIGTRTQSAKLAAELSSTVANNLELDRTAVSGVNLDEEAARLLQYQQAYQASSKVIQIAQSLFDTMLNAVAR